MLSLTIQTDENMVKNYQTAQAVNYAHRRKTMQVLLSYYLQYT